MARCGLTIDDTYRIPKGYYKDTTIIPLQWIVNQLVGNILILLISPVLMVFKPTRYLTTNSRD